MTHGFVQEQAALHRILDELNEDITFLAYGVVTGDVTNLHNEYLAAFYEEEFDDPENALGSTQKRPMIPRQKIRAYLSRIEVEGVDPSTTVSVLRTVQKAYSGFVHAASPHIMEMCVRNPPRWHLRGMLGTTRADDHRQDLWNSFYRSIASFAFVAKAFGDEDLFKSVLEYMQSFAAAAGETYAHRPSGSEA